MNSPSRGLAAGALLLYLAALVAAPYLGAVGTGAAAAVLGGLAAYLHRGRHGALPPLLAGWGAVHLATLATGGLRSPLVPLLAAWVVWVALRERSWQRPAALVAGVVPVLTAFGVAQPFDAAGAAGVALLAAIAAVLPLPEPRLRPEPAQPEPERAAPAEPQPLREDGEVLETACALVCRATDAQEAALWTTDLVAGEARRLARVGPPEPDDGRGARSVALLGHPFAWPVSERMHVRLERGRRRLPTPWAAEMLLIPVPAVDGLLALAYPGVVPPGAETAALQAAEHLEALATLLHGRRTALGSARSVGALLEAARTLPGEVRMERFGPQFVQAVRDAVGAEGAALALWDADAGRAELVHLDGDDVGSVRPGALARDGESRLALGAKHGVLLVYDDLLRERPPAPLLAAGEAWMAAPRSAVVAPLVVEDRTVGVAVAWHAEPGRFGADEVEVMRIVCSLASPPLTGARQYQALDRQASTDALTGLPNRRSFEARLSAETSQFSRYARPFSLIILDVDHFKKFNDTWGHEAGDRVLQHVGGLLRSTVRDVDLPARLGGEEFVALLPETPLAEAVEAAERLRRTLESRSVVWNGRPLKVTASFGVAACPDCTLDPDRLIPLADAALYTAKGAGRNRVAAAPCSDRAGL